MKKNVGSTDKVIRFILAAIMAGLYFSKTVTGTLGILLLVFSVTFVLTSFISFCPLYTLFGINTCSANKPNQS